MILSPVRQPNGHKKIEWFDEPVGLKLDDYEELKRRFVSRTSRCPGVVSIYEHRGPEYDLGLSDIDLIVVCEEEALSQDAFRQIRLNMEDPHASNIYRGGPVIMTRHLFRETLLNPHWELRHLHGEVLERRSLGGEEHFLALLMNAIGQSGHITASLAMRPFMTRWPVKVTLGILKGITHNYGALKGSREWPSELSHWWEQVHHLRSRWFQLDEKRYDAIQSLTFSGKKWADETNWEINALLKEKGWLRTGFDRPLILLTPRRQILAFVDSREKGEEAKKLISKRLSDWRTVVLPVFYYLHFAFMLRCTTGLFRETLNRLACPRISGIDAEAHLQGPLLSVTAQRIALEEEHFMFLRRNRFPGWGCEGEWWILLSGAEAPKYLPAKLKHYINLFRKKVDMRRSLRRLGGRENRFERCGTQAKTS